MALPMLRIADYGDDDDAIIHGSPDKSPTSSRTNVYILALAIPSGGQLTFEVSSSSLDCIAEISKHGHLTSWKMQAGPSEVLWDVRTRLGFDAMKWAVELSIGGRVRWALFRAHDRRFYVRDWDRDDSLAVFDALDRWATANGFPGD